MKAVLHQYEERPGVEEVVEPEAKGPYDVVVRVGGAGPCRADLHIVEDHWANKRLVALPYTLGHENAGWVDAVGPAVEHVQPVNAVGDVARYRMPVSGTSGNSSPRVEDRLLRGRGELPQVARPRMRRRCRPRRRAASSDESQRDQAVPPRTPTRPACGRDLCS
jgi:hypothetical protein